MSGDSAETQTEPDAGLDAKPVLHLDSLKADIVGVFQNRDDASAIEADVELARNAVERTVVEDVEVPFARIGPRVDQFLRVYTCGRRSRDIADIVGTGATLA